jgi:prepilin-type N-terminal cleavage/methylation domain-containing protein
MLNTVNIQERYRALNLLSGSDYRCRRSNGGFTLSEILVALGILAVGMAMVAAIFPAAMEFNRASNNSTLGTIICENAFALADIELSVSTIDAADTNAGDTLLRAYMGEQKYPTGDGDSKTGFVLVAQKVANTTSTYQFIAVAYRKTDNGNSVQFQEVSCTVSGKDITGGSSKLRIGSPLINRDNGEYAIIDSIDEAKSTGTLDIPKTWDLDDLKVANGSSYYVLVETGGNSGDLRRSPAIQTMSKVTGLKGGSSD